MVFLSLSCFLSLLVLGGMIRFLSLGVFVFDPLVL